MFFNNYLQNKKKAWRTNKRDFFLLFFRFFACILACKLFPYYLLFFLFLQLFCHNILRYRWSGIVFFFEESSWIEFSVTHGLLLLFFWQMKVDFDISVENWEIFPHFDKTKKNVEISDISGDLKWRLQGDETTIIRMYILRKGCIKNWYQNYFRTLNQKNFPNNSHRRSLEDGFECQISIFVSKNFLIAVKMFKYYSKIFFDHI